MIVHGLVLAGRRPKAFKAVVVIAATPRWGDWFLRFWKVRGDRFDYLRALARPAGPGPGPAMSSVDRLTAFAESRRAAVLLAGWGMFEAVVFFVIPDVLLYVLAAAAPHRAARLFAWTITGALAGSLLLFLLATFRLDLAQGLVLTVPGIDRPLLDAAILKVAGGDPGAMVQFGPGTPLKVYTVAWASGAGTILGLLAGVIVNRLSRIGPGVLLSALAGVVAPGLLRRFRWVLLVAYVATWVVYYWLRLGG